MADSVIAVLGNAIQERRLAAGWTQRAVAHAVGINVATMSHYEQGRVAPNLEILVTLAHLFDVPLSLMLAPLDRVAPIPRDQGVYRGLAKRGRKKRARPEGDPTHH